jgi:hypothetical protein
MIMTVLALVILLAVVAPAWLFSLYHQPRTVTPTPETPQPVVQMHTTATSTVKAVATPTSNMTATARVATAVQQVTNATVVARPTAIVQPTINTTDGGAQSSPAGSALYTDSLNNSRSPATTRANWEESNSCTFQSDGYHALSRSALVTCMEGNYSYGDATISVDMSLISGQLGGVIFRTSSVPFVGNYAGYLFEVDSQGNYSVSYSSMPFGNTVLQRGSITRGFRTGYHVRNTLQVVMNGSSLSFYVNGVFLDQETDTTFAAGTMGFLALYADVAYSHLRISAIA